MPTARTVLSALGIAIVCTIAACGDDKSSPAQPSPVQEQGVYSYATEGIERIGGPLPGRLRYGPASTVTVDLSGCDLTERWDALPERWAEWRYCITGDTWQLRSVTDHHEFFGQIEENSYSCSGHRIPRPAQIKVGFRWTDRCRARRVSVVARGEVISIAPLSVAGAEIEAARLRIRAAFSGRVTGAYVMDSWLRRSDGLLLRRTLDSQTRVRSPVGTVPARERYSLQIRSLQPR